jgi:uroporphyrinogen-III synthase
LVGRARQQASSLSAELKKLGADVIEIPFIEIRKPRSYRALDTALRGIAEYDWLILTSVNGVEALRARMQKLRIKVGSLEHLHIAAIGPATCAEIEKLNMKVEVVPERYVAESVIESLRGFVEGKRVLLARAKVARDVIPRQLRSMGATVDVVEAYETKVPVASKRRLRAVMNHPKLRPDVITFTSSSTVRNFVALLGRESGLGPLSRTMLDGVQFASIGPITSDTLREFGLPVHGEAEEFTIPGLVEAIGRLTN